MTEKYYCLYFATTLQLHQREFMPTTGNCIFKPWPMFLFYYFNEDKILGTAVSVPNQW